ncbi:hypothetical protein [Lacticaseibacillus sp. GG6-2]
MQYGVIGASYQQQSLAVFHAGFDAEPLTSFDQATHKAVALLVTELAASPLKDIHQLHDQIMDWLESKPSDLHRLDELVADGLTLSWFADDHFIINAMDTTEAYQLHIEVVPIKMAGGTQREA